MNRIWRGSAPSNIALIKYMGKTDAAGNRPTNRSLSFTLNGLRTHIELETASDDSLKDSWEPLVAPGLEPLALSQKGRIRFLTHLSRIKNVWGYAGGFVVRSANDFPADCGLASSASSFAALTSVACRALAELTGRSPMSEREVAELSRQGSGSSCRSLFSPWALWDTDGARAIELPFGDLLHQAVIVEDRRKDVSSSDAHARVSASPLFQGRPERAEQRLQDLMAAFESRDWRSARQICWAEFWDMHALFETTPEPFGYMNGGSLEVLDFVRREMWGEADGGPIVTMDAGANVHLLHRRDRITDLERVRTVFESRFRIIESGVVS